MQTNKTFLFLMLGHPGSGKSFVAQWLAPHLRAVHLQSDQMRTHIFGREALELHRNWRFQKQVRGAMQYAASQILMAGHSLVYDANHTAVKHRLPMRKVAQDCGVVPVIVWVKTPVALAKQRVLDREAAGGAKVFETDFVDRMASNLEPPTGDELYIEIDGSQAAGEQRRAFDAQFVEIFKDEVQ